MKLFGGALFRIHGLSRHPLFWGRTGDNRFDAPNHEYGVLYAAERFEGAFIETFGDADPHVVSKNDLLSRGVTLLQTQRELRLVDLAGSGLAQLGLDSRIFSGDHALAQQWSKAVWTHPNAVDGIWYATRHDADQRAVALFERAKDAVVARPGRSLLDPANALLTARALEAYAFALLP